MFESQARFVALVEELCPSVNGGSARRLTEALELNQSADFEDLCKLTDVDRAWITGGAERSAPRTEYWTEQLASLAGDGVRLVTIVDADYPAVLHMVHDAPPFLFVRGQLLHRDNRSVAIVGTRSASPDGIATARHLAAKLSEQSITIVSGMASGIDTAAHTGALDAGGRTIAVFGTGIRRLYPKGNAGLADRIVESGACVSQFLPDQGSTRWSFPVRNIVTSGISVGTIVVEASHTSGAKLQAHNALDHGKRVFLLKRLVEQQSWARDLIGRPGVMATDDVEEIAEAVAVDVFRVSDPSPDHRETALVM